MVDPVAGVGAVSGANGGSTVNVPYGASLSADVHAFAESLEAARSRVGMSESVEQMAKAAFEPLDLLNKEASDLGEYAKTAVESGNELTPSEIVSLTVQSQKFMFHSQLTANVANRTADGVQQLFRQQG